LTKKDRWKNGRFGLANLINIRKFDDQKSRVREEKRAVKKMTFSRKLKIIVCKSSHYLKT
jgi:hypothetical protein